MTVIEASADTVTPSVVVAESVAPAANIGIAAKDRTKIARLTKVDFISGSLLAPL